MTSGESERSKDILASGIAIGVAVALGLLFIVFTQFSVSNVEVGQGYVRTAALLWALAFLVCGSFIGFLFGIPRILTKADPDSRSALGTTTRNPPPSKYLPNTNLDEISDWLTKIIVGLGLINLQKVPTQLDRAATFVAGSLGGTPYKYFAGSIIVYFSVVGLLGMYLITRIYLARVFEKNDPGGLSDLDRHTLLRTDLTNPTRVQTRATAGIAGQIAEVPLNEITGLDNIIAWSKAQFISRNFARAVEGYRRAIEVAPNDTLLRLEYANALYYLWKSEADETKRLKLRAEAERQLLKALDLTHGPTDPVTRMKVYRALTFHFLYDSPPEGFTKTIGYADQYLNDRDPQWIPSGGLMVNLAAAYGQQWQWRKNANADPEELDDIRNKAWDAASAALKIDKEGIWRNRLRQLLQKSAEKDRSDNDLEPFENDNKFRQLLGLPEITSANSGKNGPD